MKLNINLKNILYFITIIVLMHTHLFAQNTNPVVSNVAFSIASTTVTVSYDVADAEQTTVTIVMEVSSDNGATWNYNFGTADGDIGPGVTIGNSKSITWNYSSGYNPNFMIRIIANDETADGDNCGKIYYEGGPNIDGGGAYYNTIQIGTQCWMKENLNVGTMINGSVNPTNNSTIEKYCFGNDPANCTTGGGFYEWDEAMQYVTTAGTQGICPTGWHIPTLEEFTTLSTAVSDDGNALKLVGKTPYDNTGTNTSGFFALLVGYRYYNTNYFSNLGYTYFWSSTEYDASLAYYRRLDPNISTIYEIHNQKTFGFSVRCLKD